MLAKLSAALWFSFYLTPCTQNPRVSTLSQMRPQHGNRFPIGQPAFVVAVVRQSQKGSDMESRIPLSRLAPKLRPFMGERTPGYRKLYGFVVDGVLPLKQDEQSRQYYVEEAGLPAVVEALLAVTDKRRRHRIAA